MGIYDCKTCRALITLVCGPSTVSLRSFYSLPCANLPSLFYPLLFPEYCLDLLRSRNPPLKSIPSILWVKNNNRKSPEPLSIACFSRNIRFDFILCDYVICSAVVANEVRGYGSIYEGRRGLIGVWFPRGKKGFVLGLVHWLFRLESTFIRDRYLYLSNPLPPLHNFPFRFATPLRRGILLPFILGLVGGFLFIL